MNENINQKIAIILMAAGKSTRFSQKIKQLKQFYLLKDKPIFKYSLDFFLKYSFSKIVLVLPEDKINNYYNLSEKYSNLSIISGGKTRSESVYNALKFLKTSIINDNTIEINHCIIHDAARPFIDELTFNNLLNQILNFKSLTCALKVSDTIGYGELYIKKYIDRNYTYLIQTPQAFSFEILYECYEKFFNDKNKKEFTDDTSIVYQYSKIKPKIVEGSKKLFKITNYEDIEYAKFILENNEKL